MSGQIVIWEIVPCLTMTYKLDLREYMCFFKHDKLNL